MRFMVIVQSSPEFEGGKGPSAEALEEMGKFNEEMVKAGILLAGEGLTPSSQGSRVVFSPDAEPKIVDGPFAESKELVGGFWILQGRNKEEIIEWIKRMPNTDGQHGAVEIRRIAEVSDFENLSPEAAAREEALRMRITEPQQ